MKHLFTMNLSNFRPKLLRLQLTCGEKKVFKQTPRDILWVRYVLYFNSLLISRHDTWEYSQKNWVGVCGPLPKTLTLFITKICDFSYPINDLNKNLISHSWPLRRTQLPLNIIYEGLLLMVLSIVMKRKLLLKNITSSRQECKKHTLFMNKMAKIDTLFMTKTAEKPYPLGPHIPI